MYLQDAKLWLVGMKPKNWRVVVLVIMKFSGRNAVHPHRSEGNIWLECSVEMSRVQEVKKWRAKKHQKGLGGCGDRTRSFRSKNINTHCHAEILRHDYAPTASYRHALSPATDASTASWPGPICFAASETTHQNSKGYSLLWNGWVYFIQSEHIMKKQFRMMKPLQHSLEVSLWGHLPIVQLLKAWIVTLRKAWEIQKQKWNNFLRNRARRTKSNLAISHLLDVSCPFLLAVSFSDMCSSTDFKAHLAPFQFFKILPQTSTN